MPQPLAYLNGNLVPRASLAVPVGDAGFLLGTTVAEQLRCFGGKLFHLEQHLDRLERSLEIVAVDPGLSRNQFRDLAHELLEHNHALLDKGDDLGLTIFITPGPLAAKPPQPTVCLHTQPVDFPSFAHQYTEGVSVVVTDVQQIPADCWPPELKCRSRMHYFLADRQAAARVPGARGLIVDGAGHVLEASTANFLAWFADEGLVSPPLDDVLPGISLAALKELAAGLDISFTHRPLDVAELPAARELLLTSTSPCVLPVTKLDGQPVGKGQPGPIFKQLLAAWSDRVGLDIAAQAQRFASR